MTDIIIPDDTSADDPLLGVFVGVAVVTAASVVQSEMTCFVEGDGDDAGGECVGSET